MLSGKNFILISNELAEIEQFQNINPFALESISFNRPISEDFTEKINATIKKNPDISLSISGYYQRMEQVHWHLLRDVRKMTLQDFLLGGKIDTTALSSLLELHIQDIFFRKAENLDLSPLVHLRKLSLYKVACSNNQNTFLDSIPNKSSLEELNLAKMHLQSFQFLHHLPVLKHLGLTLCSMSSGFQHLTTLSELETLLIVKLKGATQQDFSISIPVLQSLVGIMLIQNKYLTDIAFLNELEQLKILILDTAFMENSSSLTSIKRSLYKQLRDKKIVSVNQDNFSEILLSGRALIDKLKY